MLRAARHKISYDGWVLLSVSQPIWNFAQGQWGGCFIETHGFTSSLTLTARTRWHSGTWGPCLLVNEPQDGGRPSEEMAIARRTPKAHFGLWQKHDGKIRVRFPSQRRIVDMSRCGSLWKYSTRKSLLSRQKTSSLTKTWQGKELRERGVLW